MCPEIKRNHLKSDLTIVCNTTLQIVTQLTPVMREQGS